MKNLRNKIFYTVFSILSLFIILSVIAFNHQLYKQEYLGVEDNLTRMRRFINHDDLPNDDIPDRKLKKDLNNRLIMNYNVYTILLDENNNITGKVSHNDYDFDKEVLSKAKKILEEENQSQIKIGSLYFNSIAYNFNYGTSLVIVDTTLIRDRLLMTLLKSLIILIISEVLIFIISKKITDWITKPVEESFNKQKDFIASASHELKTPLSVIIASIDCIDSNKKNEKWLNNVKDESEKMNNLITRLLDLSKSEFVKQENFKLNNLSKIIEKKTMTFESLAYDKNINITTNIKSNVMFLCNENEMDELISVLVDNAIKHGIEKSVITVNLYQDKNNITIEVINEGEEIKKENREKIFERFYREDKSRNRKDNRYGLGLSIAKNIVENHNGKIKASSNNGYTTFIINFRQKR